MKSADPQGYAARKQLFDRIIADSKDNPNRPIATELQKQLQDALAKGAGFEDEKQLQEAQGAVRGGQVARGIYLGNAPASAEAKSVTAAGEALRNQRQQNALAMLEAGTSPEDVAYRRMQQSLGNLGAFVSGQSPTAQFKQVSAANSGPVSLVGGAPSTDTFGNAAGTGLSNNLSIYNAQVGYSQSQANPWLAGLSIGTGTLGTLKQINPGLFTGGGYTAPGGGSGGVGGGYSSTQFQP